MADSKIEWLARPGTRGRVWNPVTGCTKVSEGCRHCYAERQAVRFWHKQYPWVSTKPTDDSVSACRPRRFTDVQCHDDRLQMPRHWKTPSTVFVNSVSDLFHDAVPDEFVDRVFAVMACCPQHTFIVLTKRPERMLGYLTHADAPTRVAEEEELLNWADDVADDVDVSDCTLDAWPLPNVWLGVSVEDQRTADERVPLLLQTPAAVRVVSAEPLLGPVDFTARCPPFYAPHLRRDRVGWLIVGGESGQRARPCEVAWVRSLLQQGQAAGVPVFVKQLGARVRVAGDAEEVFPLGVRMVRSCPRDGDWRAVLSHRKGADPAEWPEDMRVREWPKV